MKQLQLFTRITASSWNKLTAQSPTQVHTYIQLLSMSEFFREDDM